MEFLIVVGRHNIKKFSLEISIFELVRLFAAPPPPKKRYPATGRLWYHFASQNNTNSTFHFIRWSMRIRPTKRAGDGAGACA